MSQEMKIEHWEESKDGTLSAFNMEKKLKSQGYQSIQYEFNPGTVFPDHTHGVSKKDAIVSGQFKFEMYGKVVMLQPGDTIEVPKGTVHNAAVIGGDSVIFFDATK